MKNIKILLLTGNSLFYGYKSKTSLSKLITKNEKLIQNSPQKLIKIKMYWLKLFDLNFKMLQNVCSSNKKWIANERRERRYSRKINYEPNYDIF